jgi:hypothetical protein
MSGSVRQTNALRIENKGVNPMARVAALVVLFLCVSAANAQQPTKHSPGLDAFAGICLAGAPDFLKVSEKAASFGIELMDAGSMKMGMTNDKSLAAQIKSNECTITIPSQRKLKLGEEFRALVAELTGSKQASSFPFKVQIGDKAFIVMHDRDDGEAFILLGL